MPLWTIFAEVATRTTLPACTAPKSPSGFARASKTGCTLATFSASPPYISA
ncbi:hypothetical protein SVIOM342S_10576 [Streptomyces violaceorubidus]